LLGHCSQHLDKGETHQGPIVLGIVMVAMTEELGVKMANLLGHFIIKKIYSKTIFLRTVLESSNFLSLFSLLVRHSKAIL